MSSNNAQPALVHRNLQDIIRASSESIKRHSSCHSSNRKEDAPRNLKPNNYLRTTPINESRHTSLNSSNTSLSKHSLKSKQKINIKVLPDSAQQNRYHLQKTKVEKIRNQSQTKLKRTPSNKALSSGFITQFQFFHKVDAIFTEMQDYLREIKQQLCLQAQKGTQKERIEILSFLQAESASLKNKLVTHSESLRSSRRSPTKKDQSAVRLRKSNCYQKKSHQRHLHQRQYSSQKKQQHNKSSSISQNQLGKNSRKRISQRNPSQILETIKRQDTQISVINCETQNEPFLVTQTDDQLLAMLAFQNKVSAQKKKSHTLNHQASPPLKGNTNSATCSQIKYRKALCQLNSGLGVQQFSFRSNRKDKIVSKDNKNINNKENRQKSIYQIVLQQKIQRKKAK